MTAMTAAHAARAGNPPLPFTRNAIIDQLRRQATNGPAYVQHSATRALAQLKGLYAEARYEARLAFETTRDAIREAGGQAKEEVSSGYARVAQLIDGAKVTEADLGGFAKSAKRTNDDQDEEEGSNQDDDEPP